MERSRRYPLPLWMRPAATLFNILLFAVFGILGTMAYGQRTVPAKIVLAAALTGMVAALLLAWIARRGMVVSLRESTFMAGLPRTLALEEEGVRITSAHENAFHPWPAFSGVEQRQGIVYLMLDRLSFHPIPFAAFESDAEREEFVAYVAGRIGQATAPVSVAIPVATGEQAPLPRRRAVAWRMLRDAFRLAFFRDVPEERMKRGWGWVLLAAAATLAIPALPALWKIGLAGEWNWYLVPFAVFHVALVLAASIVAAYALGRRDDVRRIALAGFLAAVAIDILAVMIGPLVADSPNPQRLVAQFAWVPGAWLALALGTYAARAVPPGGRRLGAVAACLVLIAFPLANVYRDRALWHPPYVPDDEERPGPRMGVAGEDAFYRQPALLAQELQAVLPGRSGVVDVFFVGVAGYGPQDVFMKEVNAVSGIFRERFGAEGRAIRLVNNPKTVLELPIASRTSLRAALARVAEVMDKDEDVLVLFVTSHGSDKHRLSLRLWPMAFHELDPVALRALLDESGIRNRVVIVSACYSGGFLKPLEDASTLVITASAANRTSFGCTDDAVWTYFGRAYFDEALRRTYSLTRAFEMARPVVTAREKSEKYDPSEPQISLGAAIAPKLEQLAAEREARARRSTD